MNAKRVKLLRCLLRSQGIILSQALYRVHSRTGAAVLTADCGRGRYQQLKKAMSKKPL